MSEFEDFINNNREAFENRVPDPAVLERIHEQMRSNAKKKGILIPMQMVRWAAACLILLIGGSIFWMMQKKSVTETTATATVIKPVEKASPNISIPVPQPSINNTIANKAETHTTVNEALASQRQAIFAKLNDMVSPSQRMTAAAQVLLMKNTDKEIVDALVKTMNNDPNTNVRLAALEALSRFHREPYVKKQLIASMTKQKDPMVQIGLIELLTKMKETTILKELDKMVNDGNTMDAVKDHAYSSIFTLRS